MNRIIDSRHFFDFITQNATPSEVEGIDSVAYFKCFEDICLTTRENEIEDLRKKLPLHLCPLSWLKYYQPERKYTIHKLDIEEAIEKLQILLYKGICIEPPLCDTKEEALYWARYYQLYLKQNQTCRVFWVAQPFDCKPFINHYLLIFVLDYTTEVLLFRGWD